MGLLSNRVDRDSLIPGDHIYSWRSAYIYAHHGIYVGKDKVIHFTRHGQEVGTGTVLDLLLASSGPGTEPGIKKGGPDFNFLLPCEARKIFCRFLNFWGDGRHPCPPSLRQCSGPTRSSVPCDSCIPQQEGHGVVSSCLNCFLGGGILYRFEYAVSPALFLAKARGGTCTLAASDDAEAVVHRANYLLNNGFGCYNISKNNCEDFAIYCKTGLLVLNQSTMGQSGQAVSIIGGPLAAVLATPLTLVTTNIYGMAAIAVGVYCVSRYAADVGMRNDVVKVSAEDLTKRLAIGALQVIEPSLSALPSPVT